MLLRPYRTLLTSGEELIEQRRSVALILRQHMAICVHRQRDRAMPKDLHHDARMNALRDAERGARMAPLVEAHVGQGGCGEMAFELLREGCSTHRAAARHGEDGSPAILPPCHVRTRPFRLLARPVLTELRNDDTQQGERAAARRGFG
jgi:hypothetical protein